MLGHKWSLIGIFLLILSGCSSPELPDISTSDIAETCRVDVNKLEKTIIDKTAIKFFLRQKADTPNVGHAIYIQIIPDWTSEDSQELMRIYGDEKLVQPEIGDEAYIYNGSLIYKGVGGMRSMLLVESGIAYLIEDTIPRCDEDRHLLNIADIIVK